jgi:hypothetical protein
LRQSTPRESAPSRALPRSTRLCTTTLNGEGKSTSKCAGSRVIVQPILWTFADQFRAAACGVISQLCPDSESLACWRSGSAPASIHRRLNRQPVSPFPSDYSRGALYQRIKKNARRRFAFRSLGGYGSHRRGLPKTRLDSEFVERGNQAANVVAENFAKGFVPHRHGRLAPHRVAEFRLDHAEGRFDV